MRRRRHIGKKIQKSKFIRRRFLHICKHVWSRTQYHGNSEPNPIVTYTCGKCGVVHSSTATVTWRQFFVAEQEYEEQERSKDD